jgi:hypothetical protein
LWAINKRKNRPDSPPDSPSGQGIRAARPKERALLMIYPLEGHEERADKSVPIVGMAISFPQSDTAKAIEYTVNNVFTAIGDYDDF